MTALNSSTPYRLTISERFGKVASPWGEGTCFYGSATLWYASHSNSKGTGSPSSALPIFVTLAYSHIVWRGSNQILHGDQTRWGLIFYRIHHYAVRLRPPWTRNTLCSHCVFLYLLTYVPCRYMNVYARSVCDSCRPCIYLLPYIVILDVTQQNELVLIACLLILMYWGN